MGMGIDQTGRDVPAGQPLSLGDRLPGQAPGRIHPQINRLIAVGQLNRADSPRHLDSISQASQVVRSRSSIPAAHERFERSAVTEVLLPELRNATRAWGSVTAVPGGLLGAQFHPADL